MRKHEFNSEGGQGALLTLWQKRAFQILLLLCSTSLLLVLFLLYDYEQKKNHQIQTAKNGVKQETQAAIQQVDKTLNLFLFIASDIATDISTGKLHRSQIKARLKKTMGKAPLLFGIGVAYIPYVNDPQSRRLSADYINRQNSSEITELLESFTVPCFYRFANQQYNIPKCVVFVEYVLKDITAGISTQNLGQTGYRFILSKDGVFMNHPIEKYVKNRQTLFNLAENRDDQILKQLSQHAINSDSGMIEYIDKVTKQSAWLLYQPILATGWLMCTVIYEDELFDQTPLTPKLIRISLWFLIFMVFFFAILFQAYKGETHRLWIVTVITAILLLMEIIFVYYTTTTPLGKQADRVIMLDKASLHHFLASHAKKPSLYQTQTIYIPTKVTIDSIAFSRKDQVSITGQIWQKYESHQGITPGFTLPEATSFKMNEISRDKQTEIHHWHFEATLPQTIDDSNYPLDKREMNILIQHHQAAEQNVQLLPDLEDYKEINPRLLPGIQPELVLEDWHLTRSFFNYRIEQTDKAEKEQSNLYFTVLMQRDFLKPLIISMLPVLVVVGLLFALLLLLGKVNRFANVIAPLIALFFGNLFAQMAIRKSIIVSSLSYVDYYYIVMYFSILGVAISYFLFHSHKDMIIINYQKGLIPKLLFWPLILGSILSITIWTF